MLLSVRLFTCRAEEGVKGKRRRKEQVERNLRGGVFDFFFVDKPCAAGSRFFFYSLLQKQQLVWRIKHAPATLTGAGVGRIAVKISAPRRQERMSNRHLL